MTKFFQNKALPAKLKQKSKTLPGMLQPSFTPTFALFALKIQKAAFF